MLTKSEADKLIHGLFYGNGFCTNSGYYVNLDRVIDTLKLYMNKEAVTHYTKYGVVVEDDGPGYSKYQLVSDKTAYLEQKRNKLKVQPKPIVKKSFFKRIFS